LPKEDLVKEFPKKDWKKTVLTAALAFLVVAAGVGTGWLVSGKTSLFSAKSGEAAPGASKSATEAGFSDEKTFKDSAEGILKEGGISGEGTHHLDRGIGEEKYVYLTSTVIDLQSFNDKKVQVWGQTVTARKAGWLMDVGKIKVIE